MTHWRLTILAAAVVSCVSCAGSRAQQTSTAIADRDYILTVKPNDAASRFDLALSSRSPKQLCLSVDDWPNSLGQVTGGGGRALLKLNGQDIPATETNFGYCVGKTCQTVLQPKKVLTGSVNYKEFKDPQTLRDTSSKTLQYQVHPYFCSGR